MSFNAIHLLPGSPLGRLPQAGDVAPRSLAALFIRLLRQENKWTPRGPRPPTPAPLSFMEPALPRSRTPRLAELPPRLRAERAEREPIYGAGWGAGAWEEGSGAFQGPPQPHKGSEAPPPPPPHTHTPPTVCPNDAAGGWGPMLRVVCVLEFVHSRTWKGFFWAC